MYNFTLGIIPDYLKVTLNEIIADNDQKVIIKNILWFLGLTFLAAFFLYLTRNFIIKVSRKAEKQIRADLFKKLLYFDMFFFQKQKTGDLISRLTNDLEQVRNLLGPCLMYAPNTFSRFAFFFPIMFELSPILFIITLTINSVLILLMLILLPKLRLYFKSIQEQTGTINSSAWQTISAITTIKLYQRESSEIERFDILNKEYIRRNMSLAIRRGALFPVLYYLLALVTFAILLIGGNEVIKGNMDIGELLQFSVMAAGLAFPILSIGWVIDMFQQGIAAMERLSLIFQENRRSEGDHYIIPPINFKFSKLRFYYPKKEGEEKNFSLFIEQLNISSGDILGITGSVGSGKTTLLNLLIGVLSTNKNQYFINELDCSKIHLSKFREFVGFVPQETFLFSTSIYENIALGDEEYDKKKIEYYSKLVGIYDEIQRMPDKFYQVIGERGITLSGGQKQRIALARALYKKPKILLLDDCLSAVDSKVELEILKNLFNPSASYKTVVIVSNRVSALKKTHKLIVLEKGKIVQYGEHKTLIDNKEGYYYKMSKLQEMAKEVEA